VPRLTQAAASILRHGFPCQARPPVGVQSCTTTKSGGCGSSWPLHIDIGPTGVRVNNVRELSPNLSTPATDRMGTTLSAGLSTIEATSRAHASSACRFSLAKVYRWHTPTMRQSCPMYGSTPSPSPADECPAAPYRSPRCAAGRATAIRESSPPPDRRRLPRPPNGRSQHGLVEIVLRPGLMKRSAAIREFSISRSIRFGYHLQRH
jgi:hypothetical protein